MTTTQIISSQRYRDESIVNEKRLADDRRVSLVTVEVDGTEYRVITDGHHSLQYCLDDGLEPEYEDVTDTLDTLDRERLESDPEVWLEEHWIDSEYHDPFTGQLIW